MSLAVVGLFTRLCDMQPEQQPWLAQLGESRCAKREVAGSNPGRTNTQGLQITEGKVLPLQ